ncbi:ATP-binding protein [Kitasatospora sp. GAS1066B]|uniref:ATP-binding protein n=1 Tax=Kitasatospora sp. GAS1066B TaxID=3156271 RepID=UPI0035193E24
MNDHSTVDEFRVRWSDGAVSQARTRIVGLIRDLPLSGASLADVELCASELITNALIHAGGECWVRVAWTGSHVKVQVTDRSLRLPVVLKPDWQTGSGRGLALVASFASSWGWEPNASGKAVHFLVAADTALTVAPA